MREQKLRIKIQPQIVFIVLFLFLLSIQTYAGEFYTPKDTDYALIKSLNENPEAPQRAIGKEIILISAKSNYICNGNQCIAELEVQERGNKLGSASITPLLPSQAKLEKVEKLTPFKTKEKIFLNRVMSSEIDVIKKEWREIKIEDFSHRSEEFKAQGYEVKDLYGFKEDFKTGEQKYKIHFSVPFGSSGKFDIEASYLNTSIILDPTWNSSYNFKRSYNLSVSPVYSINNSIFVVNNGSYNTSGRYLSGKLMTRCEDDSWTNASQNFKLDREYGNLSHPTYGCSNVSSAVYVCVDIMNASGTTSIYDNYNATDSAQPNTLDQCLTYTHVWHFDGDTRNSINGKDNLTIGSARITNASLWGEALNANAGSATVADSADMVWGNITIEAWINLTSNTSQQGIVAKNQVTGEFNFYFNGAGSRPRCTLYPQGTETDFGGTDTAAGYPLGRWIYVVCGYNGTHSSLYIDGKLLTVHDSVDGSNRNTGDQVEVGSYGGGGNTFTGTIDEVRISPTWRDEAYVRAQYNAILQATSAELATVDNTAPTTPSIFKPFNNSASNTSRPTFEIINSSDTDAGTQLNYTLTIYNNTALSIITFINNSIIERANTTKVQIPADILRSNATYYARTNVTDGTDWSSYSNVTTFTIDTDPPDINLTQPNNRTYNDTIRSLNVSAQRFVQVWWYSNVTASADIGKINYTFTPNGTITNLPQGTTILVVWNNDSVNNQNTTNVTFFIDSILPNIGYVANTSANNSNSTIRNIYANVSITEVNEVNITFTITNSTSQVNRTTYTTAVRFFNHSGGLNDGIHTFNVTICDVASSCNMTDTRTTTIDTSPPTINLTSPNDGDQNSSVVVRFSYNVTDINQEISTCSFYHNISASFVENASVSNPQKGTNNFSLTFASDANFRFRWGIRCNDTLGQANFSLNNTFGIDRVSPSFDTIGTPNTNNGSILNPLGFRSNITVSDSNLFSMNITIQNASGSITYYNITEDINVTSFDWNDLVNLSNFSKGTKYRLLARIDDDHTKKSIKDYSFNIDNVNNKLRFDTGDAKIDIKILSSNKAITNINTLKNIDRYNWTFQFANPTTDTNATFKLTSDKPIFYRPTSAFKGHFVTGDNWVDFNLKVAATYNVKKIDDYNYTINVFVLTTNKLEFNSIGGLNIVENSLNFTTDGTAPNITLLAPKDLTVTTEGLIRFDYNATDSLSISSCTLYLGGLSFRNNTITNASLNSISAALDDKIYNWNINCTDAGENIGNSTTFQLTLTGVLGVGGGGGGGGISPPTSFNITSEFPLVWERGKETAIKNIIVKNTDNQSMDLKKDVRILFLPLLQGDRSAFRINAITKIETGKYEIKAQSIEEAPLGEYTGVIIAGDEGEISVRYAFTLNETKIFASKDFLQALKETPEKLSNIGNSIFSFIGERITNWQWITIAGIGVALIITSIVSYALIKKRR